MTELIGQVKWFPCEVNPGPFPTERLVKIETSEGAWLIFAPLGSLRDKIRNGKTMIRGSIVAVDGDRMYVRFPGSAITTSIYEGPAGELALSVA